MTSKQSLARMLSPVLLAFYQDTRLLIAHFFILAFVFLFGFGFGFGCFVRNPTMTVALEERSAAATTAGVAGGVELKVTSAAVGGGRGGVESGDAVLGTKRNFGPVHYFGQTVLVLATVLSAYCVLKLGPNFRQDNGAIEYTVVAIPFYFFLIFVELLLMGLSKALRVAEGAKYDLADSWGSISAGATQQMFVAAIGIPLFKTFGPFFMYGVVWDKFALIHPDESKWPIWIFGFLAADCVYYWSHRFYHTNELFWAGHRVHHSSEHYNLSTALRQSWWQPVCGEFIKLPLALFVPPVVMLISFSLNTIYQFWVHTCLVDRLGPLEWILSTPSHHRVHHDRRVHKNFGGVLIIWDRIFNTCVHAAKTKGESESESE